MKTAALSCASKPLARAKGFDAQLNAAVFMQTYRPPKAAPTLINPALLVKPKVNLPPDFQQVQTQPTTNNTPTFPAVGQTGFGPTTGATPLVIGQNGTETFKRVPIRVNVNGLSKKARRLSDERREQIAIQAVARQIEPWASGREFSGRLRLRTDPVSFGGSTYNPITGSGPVTVYFDHEPTGEHVGLWKRMGRSFNRYEKGRFEVSIDNAGNASVIAFKSNAVQARVARFLNDKLHLRELFADLFQSQGARSAFFQGVGAAATAGFSLGLAGVIAGHAISDLTAGVKRRKEARTEALHRTINTIAERANQSGRFMTLQEAHRLYANTLEELKPGTIPITLSAFAKRLAVEGL